MPFSSREQGGLETEIAELVAQALDARLTFQWITAGTAGRHRLLLRRGDCDVAFGVADGAEGYLTTIAYYRSFPVFVYRKDAPFTVESFDDEVLSDLRIGVLSGAGLRPEVAALANRGLMENVVSFSWDGSGPSPLAAPVEAVAEGSVDVAVLWGPVGAYVAARQSVPLQVAAAEPKLDLPFLNLSVPIAMGVRPGDEALRDLLSEGIARRWEEIQEVLAEYGVPLDPLSPPSPSTTRQGSLSEEGLRIGLVLPLPTAEIPLEADGPEAAASLALKGAIAAEEDMGRSGDEGLRLLVGNAPSPGAAARASSRLVAAHGVRALLGGYGQQQAEIAKAAASGEIPFLDIATSSRNDPVEAGGALTFHVQASDAMYLGALAEALDEAGYRRLFLAYPEGEGALAGVAREAVAQAGGSVEVVAEAAVAGEAQLLEVLRAAKRVEADVLLALLDWRAQVDLAGLQSAVGAEAMLTGLPVPASQTRTFYYSLYEIGASTSSPQLRVTVWDPALDEGAAGELNERYFQRWGEPMDAPAWLAHAAVEILRQAAGSQDVSSGKDLVAVLAAPSSEFDVHKGVKVSFGPQDHQLRQPLYLVELNMEASSRDELVSVTRVQE